MASKSDSSDTSSVPTDSRLPKSPFLRTLASCPALANLVPSKSSPVKMPPIISMNLMSNVNFTVSNQHSASCCSPHYCISSIKDVVKLLPGYETQAWDELQSEIKNFIGLGIRRTQFPP